MLSNIYLYGSDDAGARNYFRNLFLRSALEVFEFKSISDLITLLNIIDPNKSPIILTGSSIGFNTLDKFAIVEAKEREIFCISVIDHWSWYSKRFEVADGFLYPDRIIVNDFLAKKEAIQSGLPEDLLIPLGNPVLEELSIAALNLNKSDINKRKLQVKYNLPIDKKNIVFISEELRSDFQLNNTNLLGFDEYEVFNDLVETFKDSQYQLVVKTHPAESKNKYDLILKDVIYIDVISVADLAGIADILIGMGSMLLLELSFFRDDVLSYRPNANTKFIGETLGVVVSVDSKESLNNSLLKRANNRKKFCQIFLGSRLNILNFLQRSRV